MSLVLMAQRGLRPRTRLSEISQSCEGHGYSAELQCSVAVIMRKYHDVLQWASGRVISWLEEARKGLEERGEQAERGWLGTLRWEGHLERVATRKDTAGIAGVVQWVGTSCGMKLVGRGQLHMPVFPKGTMMWDHWRISNTAAPSCELFFAAGLLWETFTSFEPTYHNLWNDPLWIFFALVFNGSLSVCRVQGTRLTLSLAKATFYFHLPTCWRLWLEGHFSSRQWDMEIFLQLGNRTFSTARALV